LSGQGWSGFASGCGRRWGEQLAPIVLFGVICRIRVRAAIPSGNSLPPLPLPHAPDPFEIACLRGGENEAARLAIFELTQRGYLEVVDQKGLPGISQGECLVQARQAPRLDPRLGCKPE